MRQVRNVIAEDEVDLAAREGFNQDVAHRLDDAEEDLGQFFPRVQGDFRAHNQHERGSNAEAYRLAMLPLAGGHISARFLHQFQDCDRPGVQEASGLGRFDAARMTDEQRDAKIFFELADLHT